MRRYFALLALAGGALAQSKVVSLFLPDFDPQKLVGSVVNANSDSTVYAIACPSTATTDECGIPGSQTIMQGSSTWSMLLTVPNGLHMTSCVNPALSSQLLSEIANMCLHISSYSANCKLDLSHEVATCTTVDSSQNSESVKLSGGDASFSDISSLMLPVTITAGLEKLKATPGGSATTTPATVTGKPAQTTTQATAKGGPAQTTTQANPQHSTTTNGANPRPTQGLY